jgi:hypothetical protein
VRRAFKPFFDDVRAHGENIYDLRLTIYEFNIGLQYNRARARCHAIANLTADLFAESSWKAPKPSYTDGVTAKFGITSDQLEQLLHESESPYLDFKRDQYRFEGAADGEKAELLKDILAFANAWRRTDAFILIGVEEVKGERGKIHGVTQHFDDATLQQFVNSKTQRAIDFSVETLTVDGRKIDAIRIPVQRRPFYLKKDYSRLKAGVVYFRRGTTTAEANPDDIATMGEDANEPRSPEPVLQFQFAEITPQWLGGQSFKEVGAAVALQMKVLDVELLEKPTSANPWLVNQPQSTHNVLQQPDEFFSSLERSNRLFEMTRGFHFAVSNSGTVSAVNVEAHLVIPRNLGLVVASNDQVHPFTNTGVDELLGKLEKGFPFGAFLNQ